VVMVKQPGHLTSMKKLRGPETSVCVPLSQMRVPGEVDRRGLTLSLWRRDSAAGAGLRRSTARTWAWSVGVVCFDRRRWRAGRRGGGGDGSVPF
jgi:hypothetical protein